MASITSIHNPRVKLWASLLQKKGRDEIGCFLVEGVQSIKEALQSEADVLTVLYHEERPIPDDLIPYRQTGDWIAVAESVLRKCSDTEQPQGVIAIVKKLSFQDGNEDILRTSTPLIIALDGVQDPGNVGTIIRSADAVGADAVILGKGSVDLYNPKTVRSTMGSLFHLAVLEADLMELLPKWKEWGIHLFGAGLNGSVSCYEAKLNEGVCWVMGNEARGLSPEVKAWLDSEVTIPMPGRSESLNVAMAATVLLFETMRQRRQE